MLSTKLFVFFFLICVSFSQLKPLRINAPAITPTIDPIFQIPVPVCPNHVHWVVALDRSGSMGWGSPTNRWEGLTDLVNGPPGSGLIGQVQDDVLSTFMFNHAAIEFPPSLGPIVHDPVPTSLPLAAQTPGGGTSFHAALMRAANIMDDYLWEHTCFVLITDGESFYSQSAVNAINNVRAKISRNCDFCARCYFIKEQQSSQIPTNFQRICKDIGAPIVTSPVNQFKSVFLKDFSAAAASFKKSAGL